MIVTFEALFLCRPLAYTWNRTVEGGSCANIKPMALSQAIINTCIDIAVLVLPMPVIWHMKMPLATKFGVVLMFSFGFGLVFTPSSLRPTANPVLDKKLFSNYKLASSPSPLSNSTEPAK